MRSIMACVALALASVTLAPLPATADDPGPVVTLGPPPRLGVDATIRAEGSSAYVGQDRYGSGQRIDQSIRKTGRAESFVRICSNVDGRVRVQGTSGGRSFRVRYLLGHLDVTRAVVAGTYRIGPRQACENEIRVLVRWRSGGSDLSRTFRVRATPPSGGRDTVSTHVTVG